MIYVIIGVLIGIIAGFNVNIVYDTTYTIYVSLVILAIINTIFTIFAESLKEEIIKSKRVIILLFSDIIIALILGFIGEQLGLPLYLAAIFAFGNNIYNNIKKSIYDFLDKKNI